MLVGPSEGGTHLSLSQTTAIYALFAVLDPENTGMIPKRDPEPGGRQRYKGSGAAEQAENLQLQIWPIYGTIWGVTCNVSKVGHQFTSLVLLHCPGLPYWHYQLVLRWYLH